MRYRALMPVLALGDAGVSAECITASAPLPSRDAIVHAIKPISKRDADWSHRAADAGRRLVVDLCDNVFVEGYGNAGHEFGDRFRALASRAAAVSVPTQSLADCVVSQCAIDSARVSVVPDVAETPDVLARERALVSDDHRPGLIARFRSRFARRSRLRAFRAIADGAPCLIWFGNHGASYASYGLSDLLLFGDALRTVARSRPILLFIVSNHVERYHGIASALGIRTRYVEWSEDVVDDLLAVSDICIVPNSGDEFSRTKSPNRALKALAAGVPVVATPTEAYGALGDAVWTGDPAEGMRRLLDDGTFRAAQLERARATIDAHYSLAALGQALVRLREAALAT